MTLKEKVLALLKEEAIPATGCTEPLAIALTAAHAYKQVPGAIRKLDLVLSSNIFKNARAVGIPGTKHKGVKIAAALGTTIENPKMDLNILSSLNEKNISSAMKLIEDDLVSFVIDSSLPSLYVGVNIETSAGKAEAIIADRHTNLIFLQKDQQIIVDKRVADPDKYSDNLDFLLSHKLDELIEATLSIEPSSLDFLIKGAGTNLRIAKAGLNLQEGLRMGEKWQELTAKGFLSEDLANKINCYTSAASDARMAGLQLPVLTVAGSGNHGLVATIPVSLVAENMAASEKQTASALALSFLVTLYVKAYTGRLTPICGCSIAAGSGCAGALVYLLRGTTAEIIMAVNNVSSTAAGMICDGGKAGCAFKLSASVTMAWQGAVLAKEAVTVPAGNGMVAGSIEQTLTNLGRLCKEGMQNVDSTLISVLSPGHKN